MAKSGKETVKKHLGSILWIFLGAFCAAYSIEVFLIPNKIIDGGIVGLSILISRFIGSQYLYPMVFLFNMPFIFLAYKNISKSFVIRMFIAVGAFSVFGTAIGHFSILKPYAGELLEIVVVGGLLLGFGVGLIIRYGGCLDGTEILGLMMNKKYSISVGTVVFAANTVLFIGLGLIFSDWHPPVQSFITFMIVMRVMDMVIMGIDEMKSVMIFSAKPKEIANVIIHQLGLGLTIIKGKGGFSGEDKDILYLMAERLQLSEIKALVHHHDPNAFIAIENLHEVASNDLKKVATKIK